MRQSNLGDLIKQAFENRIDLAAQLKDEKTNTYRLFHGVNEGRPGLTIDRYGDQVLVQTFRGPFDRPDLEIIQQQITGGLGFELDFVFSDRSPEARKHKGQERKTASSNTTDIPRTCLEIGVRYVVKDGHRGQDPFLFLDLRTARRYIMKYCEGQSVLNLFAYTCGVGACAGISGARNVWNIDFAKSSLAVGKQNAEINGISEENIRFIHSDYFPAIRQLAGLPVTGRGRKRPYPRLEARQFDLIFLDPPRWAKSPFGTVDLIRDYQGVFKPALLTVAPGGRLICTNHVPRVALADWLTILERCAAKAGRPIEEIEVIQPESDFPSPDGLHPLKIAVLHV